MNVLTEKIGTANIAHPVASMPPSGIDMSLSNIYMGPLYNYLLKYGYAIIPPDHDFFSLRWILRKQRMLIHLHWPGSYYGSKFWPKFALRASCFFSKVCIAKLRGYTFVWTVHNMYPHDADEVHAILIHRLIHHLCRLLLARLSDGLIVHSHYARKVVCKHFHIPECKTKVIPHGSLMDWYPFCESDKSAAKRALCINQNSFVYLFFGRIQSYKGVEDLIIAFKKIGRPSDCLIIAGNPSDSLKADLLSQKSSNMIMDFGFIDNEKLELYIKAADAVVLPYKRILTSGAAITALSFGKVVISPNISSFPETLEGTQSIMYDVNSLDSFAEALNLARQLDLNKAETLALKKAAIWKWDTIACDTASFFNVIGDRSLQCKGIFKS
jgi:glycosyltransferase involved in cell wall biosynthesis